MLHPQYKTVTGKVTHIFGHRFRCPRPGMATCLADDLAIQGLDQIALRLHDDMLSKSEIKPSELKVVLAHTRRQHNPDRSRD